MSKRPTSDLDRVRCANPVPPLDVVGAANTPAASALRNRILADRSPAIRPQRRTRTRALVPLIVTPVVAALTIGGGLMWLSHGNTELAQAAAAAIGGPDQIEHVVSTEGNGTRNEYWTLAGHGSLMIKTFADGAKRHYRWPGAICSILVMPTTTENCESTGAAIRRALTNGRAKALSDGTVDGRAVKRLSLESAGLKGVYEVDAATLLPVRLTISMPQVTSPTGAVIAPPQLVTEVYPVFEYLPATPENLAALGDARTRQESAEDSTQNG